MITITGVTDTTLTRKRGKTRQCKHIRKTTSHVFAHKSREKYMTDRFKTHLNTRCKQGCCYSAVNHLSTE